MISLVAQLTKEFEARERAEKRLREIFEEEVVKFMTDFQATVNERDWQQWSCPCGYTVEQLTIPERLKDTCTFTLTEVVNLAEGPSCYRKRTGLLQCYTFDIGLKRNSDLYVDVWDRYNGGCLTGHPWVQDEFFQSLANRTRKKIYVISGGTRLEDSSGWSTYPTIYKPQQITEEVSSPEVTAS